MNFSELSLRVECSGARHPSEANGRSNLFNIRYAKSPDFAPQKKHVINIAQSRETLRSGKYVKQKTRTEKYRL